MKMKIIYIVFYSNKLFIKIKKKINSLAFFHR